MSWTRLTVDNEEILYNLEGTPEEGRIVLFQNGVYFYSYDDDTFIIFAISSSNTTYF